MNKPVLTEADLTGDERERVDMWLHDLLIGDGMYDIARNLGLPPFDWTDEQQQQIWDESARLHKPHIIEAGLSDRSWR